MAGKKKAHMGPTLFIDGTKFDPKARHLFPIMLRALGSWFHQLTFAELLFAAYLSGFDHGVIACNEMEKQNGN